MFDVTMGAYDGAEICELVGCFILASLPAKYKKSDIGLYRDDGLGVQKTRNGQHGENIKKDFQKVFQKYDLEIIIQCNMKSVDYLDVTLDLSTGVYRPFRKPDNELSYVHVHSNHPPVILKQIPLSIQNRLSNLSSNEEIFKETVPYYDEALKRSGYNHNFVYTPKKNTGQRRNRKRNIIWFNPPYNNNIATDIGKQFLNLTKRHFPKNHKFHKIFNKNNVKVSYSCMPNMKAVINMHNTKISSSSEIINDNSTCNCAQKQNCPLQQGCLVKGVVYEATVTSDLHNYGEKRYIGLCESTFKKRYTSHKSTFNLERYRNNTALSAEIWRIKDLNGHPGVSWRIIRKAKPYTPNNKRCNLCLAEKFEIANFPGRNLLNKRSEIIAKCRHRRKFQLDIFEPPDVD